MPAGVANTVTLIAVPNQHIHGLTQLLHVPSLYCPVPGGVYVHDVSIYLGQHRRPPGAVPLFPPLLHGRSKVGTVPVAHRFPGVR